MIRSLKLARFVAAMVAMWTIGILFSSASLTLHLIGAQQ